MPSPDALLVNRIRRPPILRPRPGRRKRGFLVSLVVIAAAAGILGVRLATSHVTTIHTAAGVHRLVAVPASPAIEAAWGLRFTAVLLEADRGLIDMRYQVVDPAKSGRIHGGKNGATAPQTQLANMPNVVLESSGKKIGASSAMMHFEHFHFQTELLGSTYSMIYGNSGGLLNVGDKVAIQMADGLKLEHIVVAN
jgi:hypothetical protein